MDYATYVSSISFRFLQPDATRDSDGRFALRRGAGSNARLLELPYAPVDVANTVLPSREPVKRALRELCDMPRMSTIAIAAMINEAVTRMSPDHAFVNIGVWHGFSLLAAAAGNADKVCVGVDDFSQFGGPEASFRRRFETLKGANHHFYAMDYREYFSNVHRQPIGVYFYDGHHGYENQRHGLQVAEPFLADDCLVFVDDTNLMPVRRATMDFVANSRRTYRVLVDESTSTGEHPTLWNGIIVLQAGTGTSEPARELPPWREQVPAAPEVAPLGSEMANDVARQQREAAPLVSVIAHREQDDVSALRDTVDSALAQNWPAVEVLVADDRPGESAPSPWQESLLGERVALIRPDAEAGTGALVCGPRGEPRRVRVGRGRRSQAS